MERQGAGQAVAAILVPALGAVIVCAVLVQAYARMERTPIQQLQSVAPGTAISLEGIVVAADSSGFTLQDATGALPIPLDPTRLDLHVGSALLVRATRTAPRLVPAVFAAPLPRRTGVHAVPARLLSPVVPTGIAVSSIQTHDIRWALVLTLALVWLFFMNRRVRLQKSALGQASDQLRQASVIRCALHDLSTALETLTQRGTFDAQVQAQTDPDVAPLSTEVSQLIAEIQRRERAGQEADQRLKEMALIDDLTGLPNRRLLSDRLSQCITKAQRDQALFALLHIDLDGFKLVNDSLGHHTGDALLGRVAQRLKSRYRQSDTLARIGGDEFALILDAIQDRGDAHRAAELALDCFRDPFEVNGHSIQITASVGISIFPDASEYGQLLQQAGVAMYAAKRNGKNRIVLYSDDLGSAARERLTLEGALQHAIARGEISLEYQPEYDLAANSIVRFEALARWTHPTLGRIGPVSFIPVAEESGLIVSLGAYVLERACTEARSWQHIVDRPIQVAVNVSTVQFSQNSFFEEVASVLHRTGLHPSLLQIELTESATLAGIERATQMMRRFHRIGVSVAVDDFGTGYSCLTYLPKLAFDTLKLDRSFVSGLMVRRETRSFVESIITMAHNLKMKVIVEGVETREQLRLIQTLGADQAQGHFLGQPTGDPAALLREDVQRKILDQSRPVPADSKRDLADILALTDPRS
ncbi:MAG TPA: EAL domain-containing protein [Acidobacteriaceae bacterium]|jgi:diguanylate cyclase (GGDEF)-like protein|nr:EAL domain-containing protein [Acidobacteriaceae bacterium]